MGLRIMTVVIAVGGLLLYTLSLLPEAAEPPQLLAIPESQHQNLAIPGTNVYPLIYRDPALINFSPDRSPIRLEPDTSTSISRPGPDSFDSCLRPYTIHNIILQEVLS
jgi:hypothetical protein